MTKLARATILFILGLVGLTIRKEQNYPDLSAMIGVVYFLLFPIVIFESFVENLIKKVLLDITN